jgi:hypothetical protein
LLRYGANDREAANVVGALPEKVAGVPLFLLLALSVKDTLGSRLEGSAPDVLIELLKRFCAREEDRLGISSSDQIEMLTELAHWLSFDNCLSLSEAFQVLGVTRDDTGASILENPHALLLVGPNQPTDQPIAFRYPEFGDLFLAKAIRDEWRTGGFEGSVSSDFARMRLANATVDLLASLTGDEAIREAWAEAGSTPLLRSNPLVRRNILAIALAMVNERAAGESTEVRSSILQALLGNTDLSDCYLYNVSIERLDLAGWDLRRLHGQGGAIRYCTNLSSAQTDASIYSVDSLEGTPYETGSGGDRDLLLKGKTRLDRVVQSWRVKKPKVVAFIPQLRVTEVPDYGACKVMQRLGLAKLIRHYKGRLFWTLTPNGEELLLDYLRASEKEGNNGDGTGQPILRMADESKVLRQLLLDLGGR